MIDLRPLLRPLAARKDRVFRLETQVSFLAQRLGVSSQELALHGDPPMPDAARRLVAEGDKLRAMKAYRKATGASLAVAARAVDAVGGPARMS